VAQAEAGRQIVVTGNPGDGKTHLIERMRPRLEALGARVITDANACTDHEILEQWVASRDDGKPFVLAINEWPLYVLQRLAAKSGFTPVAEALRQVTSTRFFVEVHRPADATENVVVIDLSLRNLLSASVVERVIDRLTQDRFYVGLNAADPAIANRDALRDPHDDVFRSEGVEIVRIPYRAPNANAYAERWVGTVRRDCLDWLLIASRKQLEGVLRVYVEHYNTHRLHRALGLKPPAPAPRLQLIGSNPSGQIQRRERLGGLINEYTRAA
jgi:hypothetical protein